MPVADDATACDFCTYTVCSGCIPVGSSLECDDCRASRPDGARRRPEVQRDRPLRPDQIPNGCVVPDDVTVRMKSARVTFRPTSCVAASEYNNAPPLKRARLSILSCIPPRSAASRMAAWRLFDEFLTSCTSVQWSNFTAEDVSDFVVWRAAPPDTVVQTRNPVEVSTVMADLARLRAHAFATSQVAIAARLYGAEITTILKRLGSGDNHDSVRKTPVDPSVVDVLVASAEADPMDYDACFVAALVAVGIYFFTRGGELDVSNEHLRVVGRVGTFTFVHQKTKPGVGVKPKPVARSCKAPMLLRALATWDRHRPKLGTLPAFPSAPGSRKAVTTTQVRELLGKTLGKPAVLPGEERVLPWSLRAGGATMCFLAGMDPSRIMRLGRWSSEVALMYCVLTSSVQAKAWADAFQADWMI
jgi:hypothetical protein